MDEALAEQFKAKGDVLVHTSNDNTPSFYSKRNMAEKILSQGSQIYASNQSFINSCDLSKEYIKRAKERRDATSINDTTKHAQVNKPIAIPNGWNRILEKGAITYISPNKSRLRSIEDIKVYLLDAETCKCGLICPLQPEEAFSFNPYVPNVPMLLKDTSVRGCGSCHVSDAFEKLLPHLTPEEITKLLKKSSKKKKKKSSSSPEDEMKRKMKHKKSDHRHQHNSTSGTDITKRTHASSNYPTAKITGLESTHCAPGVDAVKSHLEQAGPADGLYGGSKDNQYSDHAGYSGNLKQENRRGKSKNSNRQSAAKNDASTPQVVDNVKQAAQVNIIRPTVSTVGKPKETGRKSVAKAKRPHKDNGATATTAAGKQKQRRSNQVHIGKTHDSEDHAKGTKYSFNEFQGNDKFQSRPPELQDSKMSPLGSTQQKGLSSVNTNGQLSSQHQVSLNLMTSKAPPNITLPASHSSMLPSALTQGIKSSVAQVSTPSPEEFYLGLSPGSSNSGASPNELERCKPVPEPDQFGHFKAKANVYWGSKIPAGVAETVRSSPEIQPPASERCEPSNSGRVSSNSKKHPSNQVIMPEKTVPLVKPSQADSPVSKKKLFNSNLKQQQQQQHVLNVNGIVNDTSTIPSMTRSAESLNTSSKQAKASPIGSSNPPIINAPFSSPASTIPSASALRSSAAQVLPSNGAPKQQSLAAQQTAESKLSPDKDKSEAHLDVAVSNMAQNHRPATSTAPPVGSSVSAQPGAQMVLFQFVSQSSSARPVGQTTIAGSQVSGSPMRGQSVPAFQNVYGISNAQGMVRAPSSAYQTSITPNNPAQFLIMGSQASQALQHLALQNNSLEASMHHAENPHAMYLQNLPGYSANTVKAGHQSVGFAYANVPVQFMAIGGTQVIGKQPQAHHASMEGYQPIYQYYQGGRLPEPGKLDAGKQASNPANAFVYPGIHQFSPGIPNIPNNYVRIAPAGAMTRPAFPGNPVPRFPLAPDVLKSESQCNGPSYPPKTTSNSKSPPGIVNMKFQEKIQSAELNKMAKITETLKQEAFDASEKIRSHQQNEIEKKFLNHTDSNASKSRLENCQKPPEPGPVSTQTRVISPPSGLSDLKVKRSVSADRESNTIASPGQTETKPRVNCVSNLSRVTNASKGDSEPQEAAKSSSPASFLPGTGSPKCREAVVTQGEFQPRASNVKKSDFEDPEEINLQCNEDCQTASEESRTPTPEMSNQTAAERTTEFRHRVTYGVQNASHLRIGDLIWGHQKGYSAWPGKVVSETQVGESPADAGKVWVKWFGEHTHSQIELDKLKILSEGLQDLENNSRRRKSRGSKKMSESLEKAILEALQEVNETVQDYNVYKDYMDSVRGEISANPSKKFKS